MAPNLFQHPGSHATRDRSLAPRQAPELLQELPGPHVLDQVALRPRLDGLEEGLTVVVHRQHHDGDVGHLHLQPLGRKNPVLPWELDVHQHNVRLKGAGLDQGAFGVFGFSNDDEIVLVGEERDEPLAKERMVINQ